MVEIKPLLDLVADDMVHVEEKMRSGIAARYKDLQAVIDYLKLPDCLVAMTMLLFAAIQPTDRLPVCTCATGY